MAPERNDMGRRFRNAREDAPVGTIEKRIEKDYGLPAGSVQINRPNGNNARSNKRIGNLRKEYEK